jgi:hypothetical protein
MRSVPLSSTSLSSDLPAVAKLVDFLTWGGIVSRHPAVALLRLSCRVMLGKKADHRVSWSWG